MARALGDVLPLSLTPVASKQFGGFMLSIVIGMTGIAFSLPLGILLALGRRSDMFFVKSICVGFIEFIRGVPLITLLLVASFLLNIFLPPGTNFDIILRVIIMVTLFSAAYMAETIRGGLAALPRGQYEAADALGLDYWKSMRLIIMPQALKISIPSIVNNFIACSRTRRWSRSSRCSTRSASSPRSAPTPNWNGIVWELYGFVALIFFLCCYSMSHLLEVPRAQAPHRPPLRRHPMAEPHPVDVSELAPVHTEKLKVSDEPAIEIVGMNKWYGQFHVLRDINLTVYKGERIVVCGPSGSGKSTLIRCINRLEEHQKGKIVVDGVELTSRPQEHRQGALRGRHGVPALQPLPAPDHPRELHARADLGAQDPEEGGRGGGDALPAQGQDPRAGGEVPGPALRRPAAARGDRPLALHAAEDHALRRADLARSTPR